MNDVQMIAERMMETHDFGACPILADAAEESVGSQPYSRPVGQFAVSSEELAALRAVADPPSSAVIRLVARLAGGEYAEAIRWMEEFAETISRPREGEDWDEDETDRAYGHNPIDFDKLMEICAAEGYSYYGEDTPDEARSYRNTERLIECYRLLTGNDAAKEPYFSCGC